MAINIIFFYNCFHFLDWIKLPCLLGNPGDNNGHPRPLGNPAREKGSCHALAALVSICMVSSLFSLMFIWNIVCTQVFAWGRHLRGCDRGLHGMWIHGKDHNVYYIWELRWSLWHRCDVESMISMDRCTPRPTTCYPCLGRPSSQRLPGKKLSSLFPPFFIIHYRRSKVFLPIFTFFDGQVQSEARLQKLLWHFLHQRTRWCDILIYW